MKNSHVICLILHWRASEISYQGKILLKYRLPFKSTQEKTNIERQYHTMYFETQYFEIQNNDRYPQKSAYWPKLIFKLVCNSFHSILLVNFTVLFSFTSYQNFVVLICDFSCSINYFLLLMPATMGTTGHFPNTSFQYSCSGNSYHFRLSTLRTTYLKAKYWY